MALPGFDKQTKGLNKEELKLVEGFIEGLKTKFGKSNSITCAKIIEAYKKRGIDISDARVRKIISHIRTNGLLPGLVANSNGYYRTNSSKTMDKYTMSLLGRVAKINQLINKSKEYSNFLKSKGL